MRWFVRVAVAVLAAASVAIPAASGAQTLPSFTGSCRLSGAETFTPPLGLSARPGGAQVAATGRCTGTLVVPGAGPRAISGAVASYQQATTAHMISCLGGTAHGSGVLTINGIALDFVVTEPQLTVVSQLQYTAPGWSGVGFASVTPRANPIALGTACLGAGITTVPVFLVARLQAHPTSE